MREANGSSQPRPNGLLSVLPVGHSLRRRLNPFLREPIRFRLKHALNNGMIPSVFSGAQPAQ